jgi:hypothetical protein
VRLWNAGVAAIAASWGFVSVIVAGVELPGEALVFWRCLLAAVTLPALLLLLGRLETLVLPPAPLPGAGDRAPARAPLRSLLRDDQARLGGRRHPARLHGPRAILGESVSWEVAVGGLAVLAGGALVVPREGAGPAAPDAPLATAEE